MLNQIIIFAALILGSITDLKKREVPDTLNYSLIALGITINLALSIIRSDYTLLLNSITGLAAGFAIGALFYYTGQWGGGDAKLVMGIGAVIGLNPLTIFTTLPTFILFILTSLVVGAIYGAIWLSILAIKHKKEFKKEYQKILKTNKTKKTYKIILLVCALILLIGVLINIDYKIIIFGYFTLIFLTISLYAKDFLKAIENSVLIKKIKINDLTEGDWILDEFQFKQKHINTDKTGITQEDIATLKQNGIKTIRVREGIPFVPSFFFAYITILLTNNWLILL